MVTKVLAVVMLDPDMPARAAAPARRRSPVGAGRSAPNGCENRVATTPSCPLPGSNAVTAVNARQAVVPMLQPHTILYATIWPLWKRLRDAAVQPQVRARAAQPDSYAPRDGAGVTLHGACRWFRAGSWDHQAREGTLVASSANELSSLEVACLLVYTERVVSLLRAAADMFPPPRGGLYGKCPSPGHVTLIKRVRSRHVY